MTARPGVEVTAIDREAQVVVTADGEREPYDVLVLATGSEAVVPPVPGAGRAIAFRTLDDCQAILEAAGTARRAVVVGGGLLGIEAARGLAGRGLPVTLLHLAGHLMERQLDPEAGMVLGRPWPGWAWRAGPASWSRRSWTAGYGWRTARRSRPTWWCSPAGSAR
nr:hypothetical protein GCM10020093_027120 [Planobispora longispora]